MRPGVLGPQRSRGVRKLNFYHQVQLRRQHLPAAQDAHHGGAQQHVRVAALVHRAGDARVVHFVETLHGLVAVVLSALQQVMHGHGAAVVVDVVAALADAACPLPDSESVEKYPRGQRACPFRHYAKSLRNDVTSCPSFLLAHQ